MVYASGVVMDAMLKSKNIIQVESFLEQKCVKVISCASIDGVQSLFHINNAICFPYNKEIKNILRHGDLLPFKISGVFNHKYLGYIGDEVLCKDDLLYIKNFNTLDWTADFDTVICGHVGDLELLIHENLLANIIENCVKYNKKIFSFDSLERFVPYICDKIDYYYPVINISNLPRNLLCKKIIELKINAGFTVDIKLDDIFMASKIDFFLILLKKTGFRYFFFGVESIVAAELSFYGKDSSVENIYRILDIMNSIDIEYELGFILLNPYSTSLTIQHNYKFLIEHQGYFTHLFFTKLKPIHGTTMYFKLKEEGLLVEPDGKYDSKYKIKYLHTFASALDTFFDDFFFENRDFVNSYYNMYKNPTLIMKQLVPLFAPILDSFKFTLKDLENKLQQLNKHFFDILYLAGDIESARESCPVFQTKSIEIFAKCKKIYISFLIKMHKLDTKLYRSLIANDFSSAYYNQFSFKD